MGKKKIKKSFDLNKVLEKIKEEVYKVLGEQRDNVEVIRTKEELSSYISQCINNGIISIDTETNNSLDPLTCKIMGLCLYSPNLKQVYVPINHRNKDTKERLSNQLNEEEVRTELNRIKEAKTYVLMHNGKFDYQVIKCTCGIEIEPNWDTLIAAKLLNENENHSLKYQYHLYVDNTQSVYKIDKLFEGVEYADVDPEVFGLYSATDALMTHKLYETQVHRMKNEPKIFTLFKEVEMPIVVIAAEMELLGSKVDVGYCKKLKSKYQLKLKKIDESIYEELSRLNYIIEEWKNSPLGIQPETIFITENEKKNLTPEKIQYRFPHVDDVTGERYKIGKLKRDILSDPIKLTSPKQLTVLFYEVFSAYPVKGKNQYGTGSLQLESLIEQFDDIKHVLNEYKKLYKKFEYDYDNLGMYIDGILDKEKKERTSEEEYHLLVNRKVYRLKKDLNRYFKVYNLEEIENTKKVLETIIKILELILDRRGVDKLITTYLNVVPALAKHWGDQKIRFHLNTLGAKTGRFSSGGNWKFLENGVPKVISGMNAQNIPSKNHEIRLLFHADEGKTFVSGDWSQQEPKMTACISREQKLLKVFREGKDVYATIASSIFNLPYEENLEFLNGEFNKDGKDRRSVGKVVILASTYGMSTSVVARKIKQSKDRAQEILDNFYNEYKGVKTSIDSSIKLCKTFGYIEDIWGRKRRLKDIQLPLYKARFINQPKEIDLSAEALLRYYLNRLNEEKLSDEQINYLIKEAENNNIIIESNEHLISKAERQCFNARIQGSAATMAKITMIKIFRDEELRNLDAHIVFQIHDELILECPKENAQKVSERLRYIMENSVQDKITLPMKCDMVIENRWGEEAITVDILESYTKFVEKGVENPLEELFKEYPNFPSGSLEKIVKGETNRLEFTIVDEPEEEIIVEETEKPVIKKVVEPKVKEVKPKVKKPKKEKVDLTYNSLLKELLSVGRKTIEVDGETYTFNIVGEKIIVEALRKFGAKSSYKIPIEFKDGNIDLEYEGEAQNKLLKVIFNKVSLPDEEAIEERVIKSRLSKQFKKAIEEGIVIVEEDED